MTKRQIQPTRTAETDRVPVAPVEPKPTKLDRLIALLSAPDGAAMPQLIAATDWQAHSIRGAMAGTLIRKGFAITSASTEGGRRWRITPRIAPQAGE